MTPDQSERTTKNLRAIKFHSFCLPNFLDHGHVLVPFAAAVTTKHHENIADLIVISPVNNLFLFDVHWRQHF